MSPHLTSVKMLFKTHIAFSFLVGLTFIHLMRPANQILFMILVLAGSALPDIDNVRSKVGKQFKLIGFLFAHRGIFHSVFAIIIFSLILSLVTKDYLAFSLGYLSHLIADSFTVTGIAFLYPFSNKRARGFIKTGSLSENLLFTGFVVAIFYSLVYVL